MTKERLKDAWPVDEPPRGFAENVLSRLDARGTADGTAQSPHGTDANTPSDITSLARERRVSVRSRRWLGAGLAGLALASGIVLAVWSVSMGDSFATGSLTAEARTEARIGARAQAVLEPGASVTWKSGRVQQERGDVFYRVEPGSSFVVETPAGDVVALGTCFRVQVRERAQEGTTEMNRQKLIGAAAGTALGGAALVLVYEGRVQLSRASDTLELSAGEAGQLGEHGVERVHPLEALALQRANVLQVPSQPQQLLARNDDALQRDVTEASQKLATLENEKRSLGDQLKRTQGELERRRGTVQPNGTANGTAQPNGTARPRERNEYDLAPDDWKALARSRKVKYRMPCQSPEGWAPGASDLDALGLEPDDAEVIRAAYQRSYQRVWGAIQPLCEEAIGNPDVVDTLGADTCTHVVLDIARGADRGLAQAAMVEVGETRAGLRPAPDPGVKHHPVFDLFWALTGESAALEADLAETFGPEEAKRLTFARRMCGGENSFGM